MKNRGLIMGVITVAIILIGGFFLFNNSTKITQDTNNNPQARIQPAQTPDWLSFELTDVNTEEKFNVEQFNKPVLLESFAVWCPTCTKQQKEIRSLHEEIGDQVVSISLDTDPNEDTERVKQHIQENNFNWHYAISPPELTQSLIEEFGTGIINAPSAPVVLICPDKSFTKLDSGVKKAQELKIAIKTCNN